MPCEDELQIDQPISYSSSSISSLVDSFNALDKYKSILAFTSEAAFFNCRYTRIDQSTSLYKLILLQARNLKSQVFQYDSSLDDCTDSTSEIYVSSCSEELLLLTLVLATQSLLIPQTLLV